MFRHSCAKCHYTNTRRPSDLTLADFWGWEESVPDMNTDDCGLSLVLVNTEKGREIFDAVKNQMDVREVELESCLQPNLRQPSELHKDRDAFERYYVRHGFLPTMKRFADLGWRYRVSTFFRRVHIRLGRWKRLVFEIIGIIR